MLEEARQLVAQDLEAASTAAAPSAWADSWRAEKDSEWDSTQATAPALCHVRERQPLGC